MKTKTIVNFQIGLMAMLIFMACNNPNPDRDKKAIIETLKGETMAFAKGDFDKWAGYWKQSPEILFTYTTNNASNRFLGWEMLSDAFKQTMADMGTSHATQFSRDYHTIEIGGDLAWAHFNQLDTFDGIPAQKHESRSLQRIGGAWKIIGSNVINLSSFKPGQYLLNANSVTGKTHIPIREFPKDMIINHVEGWGGMTVAINEPPAGSDFGPLLEGLENNSCQVPHWGYLEKGAIRLKYDDGKEETLKAGDVFYMPPGHTAVVEKDARLIDFSPSKEFKEVIAHIELVLS